MGHAHAVSECSRKPREGDVWRGNAADGGEKDTEQGTLYVLLVKEVREKERVQRVERVNRKEKRRNGISFLTKRGN